MPISLAQNIRSLRKQRGLTQEQLAEVLGVTVGAVYKWEAQLSQPELSTLMELADFFDTSVDVLLGYQMKDNRLQTTVERLKQYRRNKDRAGLAEAEKALKKYPNHFDVVHNSAMLYRLLGVTTHETALLRRALELLEKARLLLSQNTNSKISESTLQAEIAGCIYALGNPDQAVERLKQCNAGGLYGDLIGLILAADCHKPKEALPFLSESLLKSVVSIMQVVMGYINVFWVDKDYPSAQRLILWGIDFFASLMQQDQPSFLSKINSVFWACLACTQLYCGDEAAARQSLEQARRLARSFDLHPDYSTHSIRFACYGEPASVYDDLGETAMDGVTAVLATENPSLRRIWEEINNEEK